MSDGRQLHFCKNVYLVLVSEFCQTNHTMKKNNLLLWVLRVLAALIFLQTLFFKFTAAAESVYIFSTLGMEPWGRIGTGVMELFASILLLIPALSGWGALLGLMLMSGALFFHLIKLGVSVLDDGGQLFLYACIAWTACAILVWLQRRRTFTRFFS